MAIRLGALLLWFAAARPAAAVPAFPGAVGFGADTPGGRGGSVVEVTTVADAGPGSLREALENTSGARTVVFRTGGTIVLGSPIVMQGEADSFVTVAGQTAPGDGIQIANYGISIRDAHDVVLRFLRIRPGDGSGQFNRDIDGIELWGEQARVHHIVVDHCSLQWAMDENLSAWELVTDVTVQRSLLAETMLDGQNHDPGKGMLVGSPLPAEKPDRFSVHHNVFAHNFDRSPRIGRATTDFRNNVIYDWGGNNSSIFGDHLTNDTTAVNLVANLWRPGPSSQPEQMFAVWLQRNTLAFVDGNLGPNCPTDCANPWDLGFGEPFGQYAAASEGLYRAPAPFTAPSVGTVPAAALLATLVPNVGASLPVRDAADMRILRDVVDGTGSVGRGGPHPPLGTGTPPPDGDHDGMPDAWEASHGLNAGDPTDRNGDLDGDGYTNLEAYLAEIGPTAFGCGDGTLDPGETCDDGNTRDCDGCDTNCTPSSTCGNGVRCAPEQCDDGNRTDGDCCSAACTLEGAGAACEDGSPCTLGDTCDAGGVCRGAALPDPTCRAPIRSASSKVTIRQGAEDTRDTFVWSWTRGSATTPQDLGDPLTATGYTMCVYDGSGGPQPLLAARLPPGGLCGAKPCWSPQGTGYRYTRKTPTRATLKVKPGTIGKANVLFKTKGLPAPGLPLTPTVTVQLRNDAGQCWGDGYSAPDVNQGDAFRARGD